MNRIRKGDDVIVIAGNDKGTVGKVEALWVDENRVLVSGVNVKKKSVRANPDANEEGGIKRKHKPVHLSNVMLYDKESKKGSRVGFDVSEGRKKKKRIYKTSGHVVD